MDGFLLLKYVRLNWLSFCVQILILVYRLNMALELAKFDPTFEDIASKFFEVRHPVESFLDTPFSCFRLAAFHSDRRCNDL